MSERPWYPRYPQDFLMGTMGMSLELRGAYSILLDMMYDRQGPIPDEARYIAGMLNISVRKWTSIRADLIETGKIFVDENGFISNSRAVFEIENALKISRKRAENGAKGGNKSAEKKAELNKNNGVDQAKIKPRARVLQSQSQYKREDKPLSNARETDEAPPFDAPPDTLDALGRPTPAARHPEPLVLPACLDRRTLTPERVIETVARIKFIGSKHAAGFVDGWLQGGATLGQIHDLAIEATNTAAGDRDWMIAEIEKLKGPKNANDDAKVRARRAAITADILSD